MHSVTAVWLGALVVAAFSTPLHAQSDEVKEKPGLYTYVASWQMPRAKWADFEKPNAANDKLMSQAVSGGSLVAYGVDKTEVHRAEGSTHDSFWSAMSLGAVLEMLDAVSKGPPDTLLQSAVKHSDAIYVSHYYNWKAGTYKGAYTHSAYYKFKSSAPEDALDTLSKHFVVPVMEKLLVEGSIIEYEVDEEAIHTESPDGMWLVYITPDAASLDKVTRGVREGFKANAFIGAAFDSLFEDGEHRDYLARTTATFK